MKQYKSEDYSAFRTQQKAKAKEADIVHITADEITVLVMLTSCTDEKLHQELITEEPMSETELDKQVERYEIIKRTLKGLKTWELKHLNGVQYNNTKVLKEMLCFRCQKEGHVMSECKVPTSELKPILNNSYH